MTLNINSTVFFVTQDTKEPNNTNCEAYNSWPHRGYVMHKPQSQTLYTALQLSLTETLHNCAVRIKCLLLKYQQILHTEFIVTRG